MHQTPKWPNEKTFFGKAQRPTQAGFVPSYGRPATVGVAVAVGVCSDLPGGENTIEALVRWLGRAGAMALLLKRMT